jgi:hypothetical protein
MLQSHIIDIDGNFVGVAIRLDNGFRFIAVDPRARDISKTFWPTLADVRRISRLALLRGLGASPVVPLPEPLAT